MSGGPARLQLRDYAGAPGEHVLVPSLVGSLFPLLPPRSRRSFRIGLAVVLVTLVVAAALRFPGLFLASVALGIPLQFAQYVRQLDWRGAQVVRLMAAVVLGIGLGAAFALISGSLVAQNYSIPLESGVAAVQLRTSDIGVSVVAALLVMVPAVVIRLCSPGKRESLNGFVIGAAGGLSVAMSTTVIRMFAQLSIGLVDHDQPLPDLLIDALIRGVAVPITAVAVSGIMGAALWYTATDRRWSRFRWVLVFVAVLLGMTQVWLSGEDSAVVSQWIKVASHCLVALVAVLLLRLVLQLAFTYERMSVGSVAAPEAPSAARMVGTWIVVVVVFAAGLVGLTAATTHPVERYLCPPNCGSPPLGHPAAVNPVFTGPNGDFTVSYPAPGAAYSVSIDETGVTAEFTGGDTGAMRLFGEPARGRSAKDIATSMLHDRYPDSRVAYEIPNTLVGYRPGYGLAADDWPDGDNVSVSRTRILVMVAVKDDTALIAAAAGPYRQLGSDSGPPTGAGLELALDMGKYVNSFRWRGDVY